MLCTRQQTNTQNHTELILMQSSISCPVEVGKQAALHAKFHIHIHWELLSTNIPLILDTAQLQCMFLRCLSPRSLLLNFALEKKPQKTLGVLQLQMPF